jgi:hypothetical protein
MNQVPISTAKRVAIEQRAVGVLVLAIGGGKFSAASYGMTRRHCDAMKIVNDQIAELIREGAIKIPEALWGKA